MIARVLLTGFEPFDGFSINPSAVIAETLKGTIIGNIHVYGKVLPLDYKHALDVLRDAIDSSNPTHIISCGQSYSSDIRLERIAINAISTERADNYGYIPRSDVIIEDGPAGYFGTIDPHPIVSRLRDNGINAKISYHAGTFGCNWVYYNLLDWAANGVIKVQVLFVHLPPLPVQAEEKKDREIPFMDQDKQLKALRIIIESL